MKSQIFVMNLIIFIGFLLIFKSLESSGYATDNVVHKVTEGTPGTWKKKWTWQQRWVKNWKAKTVYVADWTKVWTPTEINEYVPLPPIPPNWIPKPSTEPTLEPTERC